MKAFEVYYESTVESENKMVILAEDESQVAHNLSQKDRNYEIGDWCFISNIIEIPFSNVMVSDLSLIELISGAEYLKGLKK